MAEEQGMKLNARGDTASRASVRVKGGRLVKAWQGKFLESLAELGVVSYACVAAGVSRQVAYKARAEDEAFAENWATACEVAADLLEAEAHRRAVEGVVEEQLSADKG